MKPTQIIHETFSAGAGVLRLMPVFVPRRFSAPGRRLRLHPDDYFALGTNRGAIKERWFASVIKCMNGPLAAKDEGVVSKQTEIHLTNVARASIGELLEDYMKPRNHTDLPDELVQQTTPNFREREEAARGL